MGELTDLERELLDFAALRWRSAGLQEQAIRERFDISATRYHQLLHGLISRPEALAYAPVTVKRLQRLEERRRRLRDTPPSGSYAGR